MNTKRTVETVDKHILTYLKSNSPANPKDISQDRFRENVVRLRCQQLVREELLEELTHELYTISEKGSECISSAGGMDSFRETIPSPSIPRITDFSELDPEDIKWRNRRYFDNPDHQYDCGQFRSRREVNRKISVVRNGDINRVMAEFPTKEMLPQQCAHWVRAIVGLHFFHDANHRTAMATLNTLLSLNGIEKINWNDEQYEVVIFKSKLIRKYIIDVRFDNLWSRDELYLLWHRYFVGQLYDVPDFSHHSPDYERLDRILERL